MMILLWALVRMGHQENHREVETDFVQPHLWNCAASFEVSSCKLGSILLVPVCVQPR